nr:MAG TPA: hypothetical protein [Caudoviricetes sp.]
MTGSHDSDEPSVRIHTRIFSPVSSNLRHGPAQHWAARSSRYS